MGTIRHPCPLSMRQCFFTLSKLENTPIEESTPTPSPGTPVLSHFPNWKTPQRKKTALPRVRGARQPNPLSKSRCLFKISNLENTPMEEGNSSEDERYKAPLWLIFNNVHKDHAYIIWKVTNH